MEKKKLLFRSYVAGWMRRLASERSREERKCEAVVLVLPCFNIKAEQEILILFSQQKEKDETLEFSGRKRAAEREKEKSGEIIKKKKKKRKQFKRRYLMQIKIF